MTEKQVIYCIFNYLFSENSRLENEVTKNLKFISSFSGSSSYIYRYWNAKKEHEDFKKFSKVIFEILKFYEE